MRIAVLSGKGGTGKTLVSVNLAAVAGKAAYIDCDVEEPNGHLFFKPQLVKTLEVNVPVPQIDDILCDGCRICVDFCKFNALALIKNKPVLFPEICHSCGGCVKLCPQKAITERPKKVGLVNEGISGNVRVYGGIMETGESSGVPILRELFQQSKKEEGLSIIDCPPGSSCMVMESIKDADYCVLVAEPTLFGTHNLNMVHELVKVFKKPFGVVLNKCVPGENPSEEFCLEHNITVLGKILFDHKLGELNSNAYVITDEAPEYRELFVNLLHRIEGEVTA